MSGGMLEGRFSTSQIEKLRASFDRIEYFDVSKLPDVRQLLSTMSDDAVKQVIEARVRWLSAMAINEAIRRGIKP